MSLFASMDTLSQTVSHALGLRELPPHFKTVLGMAGFFQTLEFASGPISALIFGQRYKSLSRHTKRGWAEHAVSMVHACTIVPLALKFALRPATFEDKAFGWDPAFGRNFAISVG